MKSNIAGIGFCVWLLLTSLPSNRDFLLKLYIGGLQTFLIDGHISYYATVRGPGVLRNVIFSGYVTFC